MLDSYVAIPLLDKLSLREALRLSSTNKDLRNSVYEEIILCIAHRKCNCTWKKMHRTQGYVRSKPSWKVFAEAEYMQWGSFMYAPVLPCRQLVILQMKHCLCRECLAPCRTFARTACGNTVIVCRKCSYDESNYSALCDRRMARQMLRNRVRNIEKALKRLHIVRIGGNRAHLYWRRDILAIATSSSQTIYTASCVRT